MPQQEYDVIIVGSGAGGGMATHLLANAGLKVALVEAGDYYDPADEGQRTQLRYPWESPRRGASTLRRPFGDYNSCIGGWHLDGEPYTMKGNTDFMWWRPHAWRPHQSLGPHSTTFRAHRFQAPGHRRTW